MYIYRRDPKCVFINYQKQKNSHYKRREIDTVNNKVHTGNQYISTQTNENDIIKQQQTRTSKAATNIPLCGVHDRSTL